MTTCPDDEVWVALLEDELTPSALAELEQHVDHCTTCRKIIASLIASHARARMQR